MNQEEALSAAIALDFSENPLLGPESPRAIAANLLSAAAPGLPAAANPLALV